MSNTIKRDFVIEELFKAQERLEGYLPWHRSRRNKNPLNLRRSPFAWFYLGGFAVFRSYNDGKRAALWDINQKLNKQSNVKVFKEKGDLATLKEYAYAWNPPSDNGPKGEEISANYLKNIIWDLNLAGIPAKAESTFKELFGEGDKQQLKILVVFHSVPNRNSFEPLLGGLANYLENAFLGTIDVSVDSIDLAETVKLKYIERNIQVGTGYEVRKFEIVDPTQIAALVEGKIKGHKILHLIDADGRGLTSSLREFIKGAVINQHNVVPNMDESSFLENLVHETLHSIYTLINKNGGNLVDEVHNYSGLFDQRPEARFAALIKKLQPQWQLI